MSAFASQLGFAVSRATALRASKPTERKVRALHVTPIRCHVGTQSSDGAAEVTRRGALRAAAAAAVLAVATPRSALAGDNVVSFEPVQNERWVAVPLSTKIPGGWAPRPGQRAKQNGSYLCLCPSCLCPCPCPCPRRRRWGFGTANDCRGVLYLCRLWRCTRRPGHPGLLGRSSTQLWLG